MCGIILTNDYKQLQAMYEANAERGKHSYSFCALDKNGRVIRLHRELGLMTPLMLSEHINMTYKDAKVFIMHNQAPTTEARGIDSVHPYEDPYRHSLLWHNGIIKPDFVSKLDSKAVWDTQILSDVLNEVYYPRTLSDVDGSFAFVFYNRNERKVMFGRNEICPLYWDFNVGKYYLSSTPVNSHYEEVQSNRIFYLDINTGIRAVVNEFTTFKMPYYLGEE